MKPHLTAVAGELPDPPYDRDTAARGYRQEIDLHRLKNSKTWILADQEVRPWLLMLWFLSWDNLPVGSWEDDNEIIAKLIGCKKEFFEGHRKQLMRGWVKHSDGRMYHPFITEQVLKMLESRHNGAERQKRFRESNKYRQEAAKERSNALLTRESRCSNGEEQEQEQEQDLNIVVPNGTTRPQQAKIPPCPHQKIIDLYHSLLPTCTHVRVWDERRKKTLMARWRENPNLDWWRGYFEFVGESKFLIGKSQPTNPNRAPFVADLEWLCKPANFAKIYEGKYHGK